MFMDDHEGGQQRNQGVISTLAASCRVESRLLLLLPNCAQEKDGNERRRGKIERKESSNGWMDGWMPVTIKMNCILLYTSDFASWPGLASS